MKNIELICKLCGKPFLNKYYSHISTYCSIECTNIGKGLTRRKSKEEIIEKFWKKVDKTPGLGPKGKCWEYNSQSKRKDYGNFYFNNLKDKGHRFSYKLHFGEIPEGLLVCHTCDNPPCVNPDHLFVGTSLDNAEDRDAKGRHITFRGERGSGAKLKEYEVRTIRKAYSTGAWSMRELGDFYKTTKQAVWLIVNRKTWKEI